MPRFRISVFDEPRAPWRNSEARAMMDARRLELASYDEAAREWYLAVPVEMQVEHDEPIIEVPFGGSAT